MFSSGGHLTFDPYISYKCQRLASTASKRDGVKYHRKNGFFEYQSHEAVEVIIRDRPRFFDQVGHQTTNASIGNKHFFTK